MVQKRLATKRALLGSCLMAVMPATNAVAQAIEDDPEYYTLDTITIEQKDVRQGEADRGASVYVAEAEMERARSGDMKDVFAGIANVAVGGAVPVAQKIFVNGVDMLNLVVSMDGVLQNNRGFHHVSANVFDPGLLKFVRVDPGVAAADTGPNAMAGAVIMETIDATDIIEEGKTFGGTARVGYGDNGNTKNASLTLGTAANGWEFLLSGRRTKGGDYKDGSGVTSTGTAANLKSGLLKVAYESDTGHRFELSGQTLIDREWRNRRANFGNGGGLVFYDTKRDNFSFKYELTDDTNPMWDPEVVFGYSSSFLNAEVTPGEDSHNKTGTYSGKFQNTFHLSNVDTIVTGLDYYDRTGHYYDTVGTSYQENARNIGVFAQARFEPTDRWKISTGLRADFQQFNGEGGFEGDYSGVSGNFSAKYAVNDNLTLRGGYSNVFGGVQIEDGYNYWRTDPAWGGPWDYAALNPSRAQNVNLGLDFTHGDFKAGGEIFKTEVEDAREYDGNFDFSTEGINLYAGYQWDLGQLRFTYSNTEARKNGQLVTSYDLVDYAAPLGQLIALEVQHYLPQANLLIGGSLDMALDYNPNVSSSGTQGLPGYEVVNLFAEYTPPSLQNLKIRGEILNLFDVDYSDRASYGGDFVGFSPIKEPGRTFVIQAIATF